MVKKIHILVVLSSYHSSQSPDEHFPELLMLDGHSEDEQFRTAPMVTSI
jgi:hypothetical protein